MTKASDNVYPRLLISEGGSTATPASGNVTVYAKADGLLYQKDDAGTETPLGPGSGGIPATIFDAKGDLIAASAADTAAKLTVGANGLFLQAASGETTGLKWAPAITRTQLGTTSAGASFATARATYAKKITFPSAGLIASVGAFVKDASGGNYVGLYPALYSDSTGPSLVRGAPSGGVLAITPTVVTNLLINTTVRAIEVAAGWWIPAAGDWWVAVTLDAGVDSRIELAYNSGTGTDRVQTNTQATDNSITAFAASSTHDYCIYVNFLT